MVLSQVGVIEAGGKVGPIFPFHDLALSHPSTSASKRTHAVEKKSMQGWGRGPSHRNRKFVEDEKVDSVVLAHKGQKRGALKEHRIALEKDVAKLRRKLKQEADIHKALERAFRRSVGALPRIPPYLPPETQELLAEVAVLEEEVIKLEERVVSLRQGLYREAVYSTSSKQSKDQTTDSEPLLTKIAAQCKSPAQVPHGVQQGRRDSLVAKLLPSIKEKDEPFSGETSRPGLQRRKSAKARVLTRKSNSIGNKSMSFGQSSNNGTPSSPPCGDQLQVCGEEAISRVNSTHQKQSSELHETGLEKENQQHKNSNLDKIWHQPSKTDATTEKPCSSVSEAVSQDHWISRPKGDDDTEATSFTPSKVVNASFFKDGETTEPNKLSEEIIRCLLSIYLKLTRPSLVSDCDSSSTVSQSTLSSTSFRSYGSRSSVSFKTSMDVSEEIDCPDPYGICAESAFRDIGPYRHHHNITANLFGHNRISSSNSLLKKLRGLVDKLSTVDLRGLTHQQKLAFWINIYNVCMMHAFLEHGIPSTPHKVVALMRKAVLNVGGQLLNALAIEHFILRLPSHPQHNYLKSGKKEKEVNMRSAYGLEWPEPLVSFALSCGSRSSPAVRVYTASEVENELEIAKSEYLQAAVGLTTKKKVVIPKLLDWYMRDFAKDAESLIEWVSEQLPGSLKSSVQECLDMRKGNGISEVIEVMPYDFNFRYLIAA